MSDFIGSFICCGQIKSKPSEHSTDQTLIVYSSNHCSYWCVRLCVTNSGQMIPLRILTKLKPNKQTDSEHWGDWERRAVNVSAYNFSYRIKLDTFYFLDDLFYRYIHLTCIHVELSTRNRFTATTKNLARSERIFLISIDFLSLCWIVSK